jgi:hypothetical protein
VKKKKARMSEFEERYLYKSPVMPQPAEGYLTRGAAKELEALSHFFFNHLESMDEESSSSKE